MKGAVINMSDRVYVTRENLYQIGAELELKGLKEPTYLSFGNHTGLDIHIQIGCDVDGGNWGPKQVNNNTIDNAKSKKIVFGNKATYCFKLWKNDSGSPGEEIGPFEHQVRLNLAGNSDHLEFVIVEIDGDYYFQVFSVREAAIIALILLTGVTE